MTDPDLLDPYRQGRLGRVPAFAPPAYHARLLSAVADALNALERAGITADVDHCAVSTRYGHVIPVGDPRLGGRWAFRARVPAGTEFSAQESCGGDLGRSASQNSAKVMPSGFT